MEFGQYRISPLHDRAVHAPLPIGDMARVSLDLREDFPLREIISRKEFAVAAELSRAREAGWLYFGKFRELFQDRHAS